MTDFVLDPVAIASLLESPDGLVGHKVIDLATIVQLNAQARAPRKTGRLIAGIVKRIVPPDTPGSVQVEVGVWTVSYAYWVHEGNDTDGSGWIYPKHQRAGGPPMLRFAADGGVVFARRVRATKPRRFLTEALATIASEL